MSTAKQHLATLLFLITLTYELCFVENMTMLAGSQSYLLLVSAVVVESEFSKQGGKNVETDVVSNLMLISAVI